jgi:hypothetical protein
MTTELDAGIEICQHVSVANFLYQMLLFFNESSKTGSSDVSADSQFVLSSFGIGIFGNGTVSGYENGSVQLHDYSSYGDYPYDSGSGTVADDVLMYSLQRSSVPTWLPHSVPLLDETNPTSPLNSLNYTDNVTHGGNDRNDDSGKYGYCACSLIFG